MTNADYMHPFGAATVERFSAAMKEARAAAAAEGTVDAEICLDHGFGETADLQIDDLVNECLAESQASRIPDSEIRAAYGTAYRAAFLSVFVAPR